MNSTLASAAYAVLRQGGAPPTHASAQLGLGRDVSHDLEACFRRRLGGVVRPSFARHDRHVAAVLAEGGFPALPERRR